MFLQSNAGWQGWATTGRAPSLAEQLHPVGAALPWPASRRGLRLTDGNINPRQRRNRFIASSEQLVEVFQVTHEKALAIPDGIRHLRPFPDGRKSMSMAQTGI